MDTVAGGTVLRLSGSGSPGTPIGFASLGFTAIVMTKSPLLSFGSLFGFASGGREGRRILSLRFAGAEIEGADIVARP